MCVCVCVCVCVAEEAKNEHALERAVTILREAVWINIHCLPVSIYSIT